MVHLSAYFHWDYQQLGLRLCIAAFHPCTACLSWLSGSDLIFLHLHPHITAPLQAHWSQHKRRHPSSPSRLKALLKMPASLPSKPLPMPLSKLKNLLREAQSQCKTRLQATQSKPSRQPRRVLTLPRTLNLPRRVARQLRMQLARLLTTQMQPRR